MELQQGEISIEFELQVKVVSETGPCMIPVDKLSHDFSE